MPSVPPRSRDSIPPPSAPPSLIGEVKAYVARHQVALADAIRDDDPLSGGEELGRRNAKVADGLLSSVDRKSVV